MSAASRKDERIAQLEAEVAYLRGVVSSLARRERELRVPVPVPAPYPLPRPYYPPYWVSGAQVQPYFSPLIASTSATATGGVVAARLG